jgi:Effector-associated domain 5/Biotin-requiring enzyme
MDRRLRSSLIDQLIQVAIELKLWERRDVLLLKIPTDFLSSMPTMKTVGDQLRSDIHHLNQVGIIRDGTDPFKIWLENAIGAIGGVQDEEVFRTALDELRRPIQDLRDASRNPSGTSEARFQSAVNPLADGVVRTGFDLSWQEAPKSWTVPAPPIDDGLTQYITVVKWLKRLGDPVVVDDPLLEIATLKVILVVHSPAAGYLRRIYVPENAAARIGEALAQIEEG